MKKAVKFLAVVAVVFSLSTTFVSCDAEEVAEAPLTELQIKEKEQLWSLGLFKDYKVISIVKVEDGSDATLTTRKNEKDDVYNFVKKDKNETWNSFKTNVIRSRNNQVIDDYGVLYLEFFPLGEKYSWNDNFMMGAGVFTFMSFRFEDLTDDEIASWNSKNGNKTLTVKDYTNKNTVPLNEKYRKISFVVVDNSAENKVDRGILFKYTLYTESLR